MLTLMMTADDFRRLALSFDGAVEQAHMGHPDFRANGRIFASLSADGTHGTLGLDAEVQQACLGDRPDIFVPAAGAWGRQGWTKVVLAKADAETVGAAMTESWRKVHAKGRKPSASGPSSRARTPSRPARSSPGK
jgi:hypothetical protein